MEQQTIQQQLDYWKRLLPTGSVWLTQQLTCRFVTVKGISYDKSIGVVVVHYAREDASGKVFKEKAGAFFNYIVSQQVQ